MDTITIVKGSLKLATSFGVNNMVNNIIKTTTPAAVSTFNKVCITIGSIVVSDMVVTKCTDHFEERFVAAITFIGNQVKSKEEKKETESKERA